MRCLILGVALLAGCGGPRCDFEVGDSVRFKVNGARGQIIETYDGWTGTCRYTVRFAAPQSQTDTRFGGDGPIDTRSISTLHRVEAFELTRGWE